MYNFPAECTRSFDIHKSTLFNIKKNELYSLTCFIFIINVEYLLNKEIKRVEAKKKYYVIKIYAILFI